MFSSGLKDTKAMGVWPVNTKEQVFEERSKRAWEVYLSMLAAAPANDQGGFSGIALKAFNAVKFFDEAKERMRKE
jgi:hypothetical protein